MSSRMGCWDVTWFLSGPPLIKVVVRIEQVEEDWNSLDHMASAQQAATARYKEILGQDPPPGPQVRSVMQDPPWS